MRLEIPYGKDGHQVLVVPDENLSAILRPNEVEFGDPLDEIRKAIARPLRSTPLKEFLVGEKDTVFIVNDGTRPTPTSIVLDAVSEIADLKRFRYLVATGAHRAPTREEYGEIFGRWHVRLEGRIHSHDCRKDEMVDLGSSRAGTRMLINAIAARARRIVIVTSVEPHYFAGYTGGRKSLLPGVAAYSTIEENHRFAMSQEAQVLKLGGNPVHEDMVDAVGRLKDISIFAIQTVLDRHHNVYRVAAGALQPSFERAVEYANEVFCVPIREKVDVVISVAPHPMDVDLYQSQKAMDNAKWALKPGGRLIFVSKCRDGIGDRVFYDQLARSTDPDEIMRNLEVEYRLGHHKAAKMAEIAKQARIGGVTSLPPDELRKISIQPFSVVQEALDAALAEKPDAKVLVMYEGSILVPRLVDNG
ncbi:MAG: nickel-dependent lactate racemase [Methanomassiliicoccales archaeon]|nr:nickel-dependent lactate racemase [Methanomassiliicoccales archaeon]